MSDIVLFIKSNFAKKKKSGLPEVHLQLQVYKSQLREKKRQTFEISRHNYLFLQYNVLHGGNQKPNCNRNSEKKNSKLSDVNSEFGEKKFNHILDFF